MAGAESPCQKRFAFQVYPCSIAPFVDETENTEALGQRKPDPFPETRWSLVVAAVGKDQPAAKRTLDELCSTYWFPVYGYFRGRAPAGKNAPRSVVEGSTRSRLTTSGPRNSFRSIPQIRRPVRMSNSNGPGREPSSAECATCSRKAIERQAGVSWSKR